MMPRGALVVILLLSVGSFLSAASPARAQSSGQNVTRRLGKIKAIDGSTITLAPDSGPEVTVMVQPNARILRLAPGEKDPKNTTPIQLTDLQVGDRIRVRGYAPDDAKTVPALEVIVITSSAVAAVSDQMRQDWQKRGIGGIVSAVDAAAGTVTISLPSLAGKKTLVIHSTPKTIIRRYAPESIKFEEAKPSRLAQINAGDQLRARGDRSADGADFTADEIVTGAFPYIEGTVKSTDASAGTLSVQDVLSKKVVEVRITADSQLHKVPDDVALRIAGMIKRAAAGALPAGVPGAGQGAGSGAGQGSAPGGGASAIASAAGGSVRPGGTGAGMGGGMGAGGGGAGGGAGFLQRMLDQTPEVKLADLHKGDAVAILAYQGTPANEIIVRLYAGVEPILTAAPNASQAMMLAPWSIGGAPGGDAGSQ
jgi:Domain of unknown function (DUF5666)